jgi:hypothetical protein
MNTDELGSNRRKYMRLEASSTVSYSDSHKPEPGRPARFTDITREGVRLISDSPLPPDSKVSLAFPIPGEPFPVLADGLVVRTILEQDGGYACGIKFTDIATEGRIKLLDHAYALWKQAQSLKDSAAKA